MAKHQRHHGREGRQPLSSLGTMLLAGAAPLALLAILAPIAGCGGDGGAAPAAASGTAAASASPTPTPAPSLPLPSPSVTIPEPSLPTGEPSVSTPTPTLEPVGPAYLSVIPGSEIIMDDGCFDYENAIAAANASAKKHQRAAKKVGNSITAAQALREKAGWVDADNLADYNATMLGLAQTALDQVSNGRAAEVAPLDQYLFDTIAFCGLADAHAAAQQRMLEVNALGEQIRLLAESSLPQTT